MGLLLLVLIIGRANAAMPWAEDLEVGDCAAVIARVPDPALDTEKFVVGRCALRLGDAKRATALLVAVDGALGNAARGELARAQVEAGDGAGATETLRGIDLPGDAEVILKARAFLLGDDAAHARAALGTPPADASAERLFWTAAADLGDSTAPSGRDDGLAALRAVWTRYPTSEFADKAASELASRGASVPDYTTDAGRALALARAKQLLKLQQAPLAVPLLEGINAQQPLTDVMFMAQAYFDAKKYPEAVSWFARAGAATASPYAAFNDALATARAGDYPTAAEKYKALIDRFPTSAQADEAAWKPGYMEYDAGHLESAIALMATYIEAHPQGKFLWDARWLRAWSFYRLGRTEEANTAFDRVISGERTGDGAGHFPGDLAVAAHYWKARAIVDPAAQKAALFDVIEQYPTSSYAYFAAARVGRTWTAQPIADPPAFSADYLAKHPTVAEARLYADAGIGEFAHVSQTDLAAVIGTPGALPMAALLVDLDRFQDARKETAPYCSTPSGRSLCTPRPYRAIVDRIAAATGLDPLLPYAIMNAESGLDPSVTSPAGARGLMQMMPALAGAIAKDQIPGFVVDDLYRAGVNTRVGTLELSLLHGAFAGQPLAGGGALPMVIAGYNGGKDAVNRWLATYAQAPDADRFAEDISFTETRRYVRKVLGYYQVYRQVYGG